MHQQSKGEDARWMGLEKAVEKLAFEQTLCRGKAMLTGKGSVLGKRLWVPVHMPGSWAQCFRDWAGEMKWSDV